MYGSISNLARSTTAALIAAVCLGAPLASAGGLPPLPDAVPVIDLPASSFVSAPMINSWIAQDRRISMKTHAWDLFGALMRPLYTNDGNTVRLYDTWHSLDEVVPPVGSPVPGFGAAVVTRAKARFGHLDGESSVHGNPQPSLTRTPLTLAEAIVADVKYNPAIGRAVENGLTKVTLDANGQKVVAGYSLKDMLRPGRIASLGFNDTRAVMLKPAFTIIKGKGPTVMARWEESPNVTNPPSADFYAKPKNANARVASERTWVKEALVYPAMTSSWSSPVYYDRFGNQIAAPANLTSLPKFNLSDFHYIRLNQVQVDALKTGILSELMGPNIDNIEVGDYAVLTSMHIATREIDTWTWQTFWWQPIGGEDLAQNGASAALRSKMASDPYYKPLKHFRAGVGYSYSTPWGRGVIASNPYLEGSFGMPNDLAAVFGANADTGGVNVFLRTNNDVPLYFRGIAYVKPDAFGLKTNCVTCHYAAAYPTDSKGTLPPTTRGIYPDWGLPPGNEALLVSRIRTHFLWGVANKIRDREIDAGQ